MKVAILLGELTARGGAPRQALELAAQLESLGHSSTVFAVRYCPETCYPELAAALDIRAVERLTRKEIERRPSRPHHGLRHGFGRHFLESRALAQLVARERFDILNPHVRGATRAAVACKRATGAPVVWMCDDARHWEQPGYRPCYPPPVQWIFDRAMARAEKSVVREIDRIIALDARVAGILGRYYQRPVEVIRSGLDAARFHPKPESRRPIRARHGIAPDDFVLLWLGILEPHRRLEDAIAAVRLLKEQGRAKIRLLIAGASNYAAPYIEKLRALTARFQLETEITFHDAAIEESEMADYYSAASALVYLAENQCWGLGVFEAIGCGLPVIVSRACGAREVLENRRTAMLVNPRDPAGLADAIGELEDSPALRESLSARARAEILPQITWENYARNMLRAFETVLGGGRSSPARTPQEAFA